MQRIGTHYRESREVIIATDSKKEANLEIDKHKKLFPKSGWYYSIYKSDIGLFKFKAVVDKSGVKNG